MKSWPSSYSGGSFYLNAVFSIPPKYIVICLTILIMLPWILLLGLLQCTNILQPSLNVIIVLKSSVLATIMESIEIEELFASCESIGFVFVELC